MNAIVIVIITLLTVGIAGGNEFWQRVCCAAMAAMAVIFLFGIMVNVKAIAVALGA